MVNLSEVAAKIDPDEARFAVAKVMAALGCQTDWNSETLDWVADAVGGLAARTGLPDIFDQDDAAVEFWKGV